MILIDGKPRLLRGAFLKKQTQSRRSRSLRETPFHSYYCMSVAETQKKKMQNKPNVKVGKSRNVSTHAKHRSRRNISRSSLPLRGGEANVNIGRLPRSSRMSPLLQNKPNSCPVPRHDISEYKKRTDTHTYDQNLLCKTNPICTIVKSPQSLFKEALIISYPAVAKYKTKLTALSRHPRMSVTGTQRRI